MLCSMMEVLRRWPLTAGAPPNWPAETSTLYVFSAAVTSATERLKSVSLSGLSQMRMAYCEPKFSTSPTPGIRASTFSRFDCA